MDYLAQTDFNSPSIRYFSFILLGLMLSVGWVIWRMVGKKKTTNSGRSVEELLSDAEADALRQARARREKKDDDEDDEEVLALTPLQELERQRVEKIVRSQADTDPQDSDSEEK